MATYSGNTVYIDVDGTDIGTTYFRKLEFNRSVATTDVTAGSAATDVERAAALKDTDGTITIVYDTALIATHLGLFNPGVHILTIGPEGNATGKPKHVQSVIFTSEPIVVDVTKALVELACPFVGAAAPTTDMSGGGVWA